MKIDTNVLNQIIFLSELEKIYKELLQTNCISCPHEFTGLSNLTKISRDQTYDEGNMDQISNPGKKCRDTTLYKNAPNSIKYELFNLLDIKVEGTPLNFFPKDWKGK